MIELLIAMTVLSFGILALFALFEAGMMQLRRASHVSTAAALADSEMEAYRAVKFSVIGLDDADVAGADALYKSYSAYREDTPSTSLVADVGSTSTSISVSSASGFPAVAPFRIKIDAEVLIVEALSQPTVWTVKRGADGTTPAAHSAATALVVQKKRAHVPKCGTAPCTTSVPTKTVTGADNKSYRVDTYVTWQSVQNNIGDAGRSVKLVTLVVRDGATPGSVYARVSSSFDESTGCALKDGTTVC